MYSSLLLLSLLHFTTCTVYTVTPDDHYYPNTTCHHCHNLQHYLLNITKYFTSNTQLLFLPGLHHLHTDLAIQNVHNISLIGSTFRTNGVKQSTTIYITFEFSSILIINVSNLIIKNMVISAQNSQESHEPSEWILLTIKDCSFVVLNNLLVYESMKRTPHNFALVGINIMGNSHFDHVKCFDKIQLFYNETNTNEESEHPILSMRNCTATKIKLSMVQGSYKVTMKMTDTLLRYTVHKPTDDPLISIDELGANEVLLINCQFIKNVYTDQMLLFSGSSNGSVKLIDCQFISNANFYTMVYIVMHNVMQVSPHQYVKPALIKLHMNVRLELENCRFHSNSEREAQIIQALGMCNSTNPVTIVIKNTTFSYYTTKTTNPYQDWFDADMLDLSFIYLSNSLILLETLVVFNNITTPNGIISLNENSTIIISGSVEFSRNVGQSLINFYDNNIEYIVMKENSVITINHNAVWSLFAIKHTARYRYPFCIFQYFSNNTSPATMDNRNFLIKFYNNQCKQFLKLSCHDYMPLTHCLWLSQSLFNNNTIPLQVNSNYMQFINNSGTYELSQIIEQSSLCVCTNELHPDCHIDDLGYLYPGETLTTFLYHHTVDTPNVVVVKTDITQQHVTPCIVLNISENLQLIGKHCTQLHYTIGFPTESYCEIFLKLASDSDEYLNIFYVRQITCPTGFVKIDKRCQCDPVLVQYGITYCNINDQTILRPTNIWVSATTQNDSFTYDLSLHCPFHYCLPHSSYLNFSTPNSQCQFNRSGLLCGYCQQGLSTVFSSSHCQHCSSIYLLLIIPIAIAGILLVSMLFTLNLTVTDGTICGFILYANIISINTPAIFAELNHFSPMYTFISLVNLDLGIQTCFYNGMDDYAKMWLQLAFPFYLIFIAALIIITSRYSTTIQRLTARRALPVLATLFLLSYTKILRIVSSVLFFYSTITYLPSEHTTLVWSVDANVPLFGVRFTILFIVCLILFLILIPFNVILLFSKPLSKFRFLKPLLDAYQGPYKDKFNYWTGLQLLMRSVFFGIATLDKNVNFTISIILFGIMGIIQGAVNPFKIHCRNYQELILMLNLQGLYTILLYSTDNSLTIVNVMIAMVTFQFICIIGYHIITYVCSGVIRNKIPLSVHTLTGWIDRIHNKFKHQQLFQHQQFIHLQDNV